MVMVSYRLWQWCLTVYGNGVLPFMALIAITASYCTNTVSISNEDCFITISISGEDCLRTPPEQSYKYKDCLPTISIDGCQMLDGDTPQSISTT